MAEALQHVAVAEPAGVRIAPLASAPGGPVVLEPARELGDPLAWAAAERDALDQLTRTHGGVLLRGFAIEDPDHLQALIDALYGAAMPYLDRAAPRTRIRGHVYTATDYPRDLRVFLHNESSFAARWPLKIAFLCGTPAETGGATPIADVRRVLERLDARLVRRFEKHGVLYVRNFGARPFGLRWQVVFQTEDRTELESWCEDAGIELEWRGETLRTRQRRPAVALHPETRERVWFNHAAVFHVSTLEERQRKALLKLMSETELPQNVYYGDGAPIAAEAMDAVRDAYRRETRVFEWRAGDVLLLDNMLMAHGREPFTGERRVFVTMAAPIGLGGPES